MKILVISQNFYPEIGSGANRIKNLYMYLSKLHDVEILTTTPTYPNKTIYRESKYWDTPEINNSDDILRIPMRLNKQSKSMYVRLLYYMELSFKVRRFLKRHQHKYDVIYVTSPNIFLAWVTLLLQPKIKGLNRILEVRDLWPDSVSKIDKININWLFKPLQYLEETMYRRADKIVINNEGFRPHIMERAPDSDIFYLPNALTDKEIEPGKTSNEFKVLYTGNLGFAQNLEQLKEVAQLLEDRNILFNIIGYGVHAHALRDFVTSQKFNYVNVYEATNRAESLEAIKRHNVQLSLLKTDDVFMNVLPGKIIDGIGCNTVVVTNIGGYANHLIHKYDVGIAVEAGSAHEIVEAIANLRDNPSLEAHYKNNMKHLLEEEFLWSKNIHKLDKFLTR